MVTRAFAVEDGNLSTRSLITTRNKLFSDIDLTFTNRPSGDLYKKTDAAAVKQAVKNLLLTIDQACMTFRLPNTFCVGESTSNRRFL